MTIYEACIVTNGLFVLFISTISCCDANDNDDNDVNNNDNDINHNGNNNDNQNQNVNHQLPIANRNGNENFQLFKMLESTFLFIFLMTICTGLLFNSNIIQTGEIDINESDLIFTIFWFHIVSHVCKDDYGILTMFGQNSKLKHKIAGILCIIAMYSFSLGIVALTTYKVYCEICSNILIGLVSLSIMYQETKERRERMKNCFYCVSLMLIIMFGLVYFAIGIFSIVNYYMKEHLEQHLALVELLLSMVITGFGLILENYQPIPAHEQINQAKGNYGAIQLQGSG